MSIEEAFYNLILAVERETGVSDGLTKVAFSRQAFDHILFEMHQKDRHSLSVTTIADGGARLFGVPIVAREKEDF